MIDEIRERTDLVALVERHVRLQRRGNSHVGLCPFHQEKTPSFHVVPHKHLFHCFGCGAGGDAFKFLMELEGLSFMEAVRELAQSAGVDLPDRELTPDERKKLRERAGLYEVLDAASRFYEAVLMSHPEGAPGREYLKVRGISPDTAMKWRLGFAPDGWTTTLDVLQRRGFPVDLIHAAGLAKRKERDNGRTSHYDTFRGRVTIPITDTRGRVIAFGARLLEGDGPKYLNSPETALYRKKATLYGLEHARQPIQREGRVMLVEGYFDVIAMHEAGFGEVLATCGTALTSDHLETLRRLTDKAIALFDADEAGARAAEKSLPLFFQAGVTPFRLDVPGAKDPDELVREEGPQAMEAALERVEPLLEWVIDQRLLKRASSAQEREEHANTLVPLLALTHGTDMVARVAKRLRIHLDVLLPRVERARREAARGRVRRDPMEIVPDAAPSERRPPPGPRRSPPPMDDGPPPMDDEAYGFLPEDDEEVAPMEAPPPEPWKPTRDLVHILWLLVHRRDEVLPLTQALGPTAWARQGAVVPTLGELLEGTAAAALLPELEDPGVRRTLMAVVARETLYTSDQAARGMAQALHRLLLPQLEDHLYGLDEDARRAYATRDYEAQGRATATAMALRKDLNAMKTSLNAGDLTAYAKRAVAAIDRVSPPEADEKLSTGFIGG